MASGDAPHRLLRARQPAGRVPEVAHVVAEDAEGLRHSLAGKARRRLAERRSLAVLPPCWARSPRPATVCGRLNFSPTSLHRGKKRRTSAVPRGYEHVPLLHARFSSRASLLRSLSEPRPAPPSPPRRRSPRRLRRRRSSRPRAASPRTSGRPGRRRPVRRAGAQGARQIARDGRRRRLRPMASPTTPRTRSTELEFGRGRVRCAPLHASPLPSSVRCCAALRRGVLACSAAAARPSAARAAAARVRPCRPIRSPRTRRARERRSRCARGARGPRCSSSTRR